LKENEIYHFEVKGFNSKNNKNDVLDCLL